jgi:hypothetical protein
VFLRASPSRAPNKIDSDRGSLAALAAPALLAIDFAAPLATRSPLGQEVQQQLHLATKKERKPAMSDNDQLSARVLRQFTGGLAQDWGYRVRRLSLASVV